MLLSIKERIGTGDVWPKNEMWQKSFMDYFRNLSSTSHSFKLLPSYVDSLEGNITTDNGQKIGIFIFYSIEKMQKEYSHSWYKNRSRLVVEKCPYLGPERGWFAYTISDRDCFRRFTELVIRVSRGAVIDTRLGISTSAVVNRQMYVSWTINNFDQFEKDQNKKKTRKVTFSQVNFRSSHNPPYLHALSPLMRASSYSRHITNELAVVVKPNQPMGLVTITIWVVQTIASVSMKEALSNSYEGEEPSSETTGDDSFETSSSSSF
eukprot:TRINITY_DN4759_c0_g1_i14.p1 TRINITY_DN4759_c0_g1~~TRINITY_DN4759_c0_g1_i14.p1  ORF type:complete len:264 (-),score=45.65 TRINITY_DN4759_c0_g1_i14:168-959(-)